MKIENKPKVVKDGESSRDVEFTDSGVESLDRRDSLRRQNPNNPTNKAPCSICGNPKVCELFGDREVCRECLE